MKAQVIAAGALAFLVFTAMPVSSQTSKAASAAQDKAAAPAKTADAQADTAKTEVLFPEVQRISAEELKKMMEKKAPLVLVDTRDSLAYDDGHLAGAVNIVYDPTSDPRDREPTLLALPTDKLVVLYCECNNEEDSAPMAAQMLELGYDHDKVKALRGGSIKWRDLHYPFVASTPSADAEKAQ